MFSNNNRSLNNSKLKNIKYLVVKEQSQNDKLSIEHISTNSMIADSLTKVVSSKVFLEHIAYMSLTLYEIMYLLWEFCICVLININVV